MVPPLHRRLPGVFLLLAAASAATAQSRTIEWGTTLEPKATLAAAKALAGTLANPAAANWRAKGDQKRTYRFAEANVTSPYRLCVPSSWDGKTPLALVMFLHGAGNTESSYLEADNKLMIRLADQHGVLLVSAMGVASAYGTFLRLPAVFGKPDEVAPLLARRTAATELANQLSEKDVLNVLELVKAEYPVDTANMFLTGHSMGSGGTWYLGGKYPELWRGLAPMSGPFVTETGYPWDRVLKMPVLVTEGTNTASLQGSRDLHQWMKGRGGKIKYKEVAADHAGMVPLVLPDVYDFFDSLRRSATGVARSARRPPTSAGAIVIHQTGAPLRIPVPEDLSGESLELALVDLSGRTRHAGRVPTRDGAAVLEGTSLPAGLYRARWRRE